MKEKWLMAKKHVVSFNLLAISYVVCFTGCNNHLDDAIIGERPLNANPSTTIASTQHVDCLYQRWYEGDVKTKANSGTEGFGFTTLLGFIGQQIAGNAFFLLEGYAAEELVGIFIPDETQSKLDEIINRLGDIQTSIDALKNEVKLANYDGAFREKETMYINLQSKTVDSWLTLQALDKNKNLSLEERISKRKEVVRKWGESNINGAGSANYATINYAKKVMSIAAEQKNYFQVYDEFASKFFGFEQESFAWRENCRDRDIALLAIAFSLSNMYENLINTPDDISSLGQTVLSMEKFSSIYKVNYDTYNSGVNICYIPRMEGRKFQKEILEVPYDWYTDYKNGVSKEMRTGNIMYVDKGSSDSDYTYLPTVMNYGNNSVPRKYKHLNRGEIELIYKFYNSRSEQKMSLEEILCSVGFSVKGSSTKVNSRILFSSDGYDVEHEHWYNYNFILYYRGVVFDSKDWNSGDFRLGVIWCKAASRQPVLTITQWDSAPDSNQRFYCLYYSE
jgi:hypothetical protein